MSPDVVRELRAAIDDLWGVISKAEIDQLQPGTREIAQQNHELLWHAGRAPHSVVSAPKPLATCVAECDWLTTRRHAEGCRPEAR